VGLGRQENRRTMGLLVLRGFLGAAAVGCYYASVELLPLNIATTIFFLNPAAAVLLEALIYWQVGGGLSPRWVGLGGAGPPGAPAGVAHAAARNPHSRSRPRAASPATGVVKGSDPPPPTSERRQLSAASTSAQRRQLTPPARAPAGALCRRHLRLPAHPVRRGAHWRPQLPPASWPASRPGRRRRPGPAGHGHRAGRGGGHRQCRQLLHSFPHRAPDQPHCGHLVVPCNCAAGVPRALGGPSNCLAAAQ
jgi:hypothetical protein